MKRLITLGAALAATMAVATLPQFVISALAPVLLPEFSLTRVQVGLLTTALFVASAVTSPLAGRLVDAVADRVVIGAVFVTTGLSLVGMALAPEYGWLVAAAAVAGLGQALGNPVTNRVIVGTVQQHRQGIVTGVKQSGVQFGALVVGIALPLGVATVGWQRSLVLAAGGLVAVLALTLAGTPSARPGRTRSARPGRTRSARPSEAPVSPAAGAPARPAAGAPATSLAGGSPETGRLALRDVVPWLGGYAFFIGGGAAGTFTYLPLYAHERLGFSVGLAGTVVGFVGLIGVLARLSWGHAADRADSTSGVLVGLGVGAVVSAVTLMAAPALGSWSLWIGAFLFGATAAAWNAVGMAAIVKRVATADTGTASGLVMFGFFAGYIGSPLAFGALVDASGAYGAAWLMVLALYVCAAAIAGIWHRHLKRGTDDPSDQDVPFA